MNWKISPSYSKLTEFVTELPHNFSKSGKVLFKKRNEIRMISIEGYDVNVKSFKIPHLINKIAYKYFRGSKARHSFEYGIRLSDLDVNTPEPIAYIETSKGGLFHKSFYISKQHVYDFTIRDLIGFDFLDKENILKQFTTFTYEKLHKNNIHHLDYSRGNILITRLENQQYDFSIVDINRMRFEKMGYIKGLKNFAQLWANEKELEIIAKEYARINDKHEEEAIKLLIQFDKDHKIKIHKKSAWKRRIRGDKK